MILTFHQLQGSGHRWPSQEEAPLQSPQLPNELINWELPGEAHAESENKEQEVLTVLTN